MNLWFKKTMWPDLSTIHFHFPIMINIPRLYIPRKVCLFRMLSRRRIKYPKKKCFLGFSDSKDEYKSLNNHHLQFKQLMKCYDQYRQMKGITELNSQGGYDADPLKIASVFQNSHDASLWCSLSCFKTARGLGQEGWMPCNKQGEETWEI